MKKVITTEVVAAYSHCPRKAFLLLCTAEKGIPHAYVHIIQQRKKDHQRKYIRTLKQKNRDVQPYNVDNLKNGSDFLINVTLKVEGVEADCGVLTKVQGSSSLGRYSYEPTVFVGTHNISKDQKLEIFFAGYILGQIQNKLPLTGRMIRMGGKSHKVKLENSIKTLIPLLEPLQEWTIDPPSDPPIVILNKHCPYCQFRSLCKAKAEQEDNLSLLSTISTSKAVQSYENKGIFTVKQLSYLFKPRKCKKRVVKLPVTHKPELQALAIRTGKIYLQQLPELSRRPVELFLDIEGIPDQQFYYLIGPLVCKSDIAIQYSFWADTLQHEAQIWHQFIEKINQYPDAPIYHYGSFEPKAINKLARRYETDIENIKNHLVNINKYIYSRVYFPIRSNKLKEIGSFIGASWTSAQASGLQSLVWRHYWDETQSAKYQELLITYNEEDCQALKLLTDELSRIKHSADILSEVDFANQPKRYTTEASEQVHSQFEAILKFAHANYDKKKISFRQNKKNESVQHKEMKKFGSKKGYQGQRRVRPKATKIIKVPDGTVCPKCKNKLIQSSEQTSKRLIIDLVLTRSGIRKTITEYIGTQGHCSKCHRPYSPPGIRQYGPNQLYGHGFRAWVIYQRVALRMTYACIAEVVEELFNEKKIRSNIQRFIKDFGQYYVETEKIIVDHMLQSPFIHADETPINIMGIGQYVWVFTDGKYVVFKLRKTREATVVHEFLENYKGVLISDFYAGYDSVKCKQQKCWVHLIRDLNNDIWNTPFNTEFETFVLEVRNLMVPIMEAVQKYGLKKRNLNKFRKQVDIFYKDVITDKYYRSELTIKYQKRFVRYRDGLFTFLTQDGIPWENNTAERAIRHIVRQQIISEKFHESATHDFLRLLSIRQSCRFQGISFFKFLFSGEKDIDKFRTPKRPKISTPVGLPRSKKTI